MFIITIQKKLVPPTPLPQAPLLHGGLIGGINSAKENEIGSRDLMNLDFRTRESTKGNHLDWKHSIPGAFTEATMFQRTPSTIVARYPGDL